MDNKVLSSIYLSFYHTSLTSKRNISLSFIITLFIQLTEFM